MSKFIFHIRNALYGLLANKLLNLIVLISVVVGLMYPVIACTISERILLDAKLSEYKDAEHISILEFFAPYTEQAECDVKIRGLTDRIDEFGYESLYFVNVNWNNQKFLRGVAGYTENYLKLEGYELREGRLITEEELAEGKPVCMLQAKGDHDFKVGDILSFMGSSYKVVGIINAPKCYGKILIPYKAMEAFIGRNNIQYKLIVHTKQEPNINEMSRKLNFVNSIISVGTADENSKPYYASIWALIQERIGIGLIVLLFAVISIIMIIVGKTIDDQYVLGVKMAVGASVGRVFIESFLQNSILMIIALFVDFLLFPIVKHYYRLIYSNPDIYIFMIMLVMCLIIAFFVSVLGTAFVLRKRAISVLLKIR